MRLTNQLEGEVRIVSENPTHINVENFIEKLLNHTFYKGADEEKKEWLDAVRYFVSCFWRNETDSFCKNLIKKLYVAALSLKFDHPQKHQEYYQLLSSFADNCSWDDDPFDFGIVPESLHHIMWDPNDWANGYFAHARISIINSKFCFKSKDRYTVWLKRVWKWQKEYRELWDNL